MITFNNYYPTSSNLIITKLCKIRKQNEFRSDEQNVKFSSYSSAQLFSFLYRKQSAFLHLKVIIIRANQVEK